MIIILHRISVCCSTCRLSRNEIRSHSSSQQDIRESVTFEDLSMSMNISIASMSSTGNSPLEHDLEVPMRPVRRDPSTPSGGPESIHLHDVWRPGTKNLSHTHRGCHPTQSWIWILNFLIAISVGICSQVVHYGMENLGDSRIYLIDLMLPNIWKAWALNFLICLVFVGIACKCVEWQPSSISSGIPGQKPFNGRNRFESGFVCIIYISQHTSVYTNCVSRP